MSCTCATATPTPSCGCRCGCKSTSPDASAPTAPPPTNPSATVPGTLPPKPLSARQPEVLPPPTYAPKRARQPEEVPLPAVALRTARQPEYLPPPAPYTGKVAQQPQAVSAPAVVPTHRTVLKNVGVVTGEGPPRRASGEVVGELLSPPSNVPMHRAVARQPEVLPVNAPPRRASGELAGEYLVSDGLVRRASGEVVVSPPSRLEARQPEVLTTGGMRAGDVKALEAGKGGKAAVKPVVETTGMRGAEVRAVEAGTPVLAPGAMPTLSVRAEAALMLRDAAEAGAKLWTWEATRDEHGPRARLLSVLPFDGPREPDADRVPRPSLAPMGVGRPSPGSGGRVRAVIALRWTDEVGGLGARLQQVLRRVPRGLRPDFEAAQRLALETRAASLAAVATPVERALRGLGLRLVPRVPQSALIHVRGTLAQLELARRIPGVLEIGSDDEEAIEDSWGSEIRGAMGVQTAWRTDEVGEGVLMSMDEPSLPDWRHPMFRAGPSRGVPRVPGGCDAVPRWPEGPIPSACQVILQPTRIERARYCRFDGDERLACTNFPDRGDVGVKQGHASGTAAVLMGDLSRGQDPWYRAKLMAQAGADTIPSSTLNVPLRALDQDTLQRLGGGLTRAKLWAWRGDAGAVHEDIVGGDAPARVHNRSASKFDYRRASEGAAGRSYVPAKSGKRYLGDTRAQSLFDHNILLVKSAGNYNKDELLLTCSAALAEVMRWIRSQVGSRLDTLWLRLPRIVYAQGSALAMCAEMDKVGLDAYPGTAGELAQEMSKRTGWDHIIDSMAVEAPWRAPIGTPEFVPLASLVSRDVIWHRLGCTPGLPGHYCNEQGRGDEGVELANVGAPNGQAVLVVGARNLRSRFPRYGAQSLGGTFTSDSGATRRRTVIGVSGIQPFTFQPVGPFDYSYASPETFNATSAAAPTVAATLGLLQARFRERGEDAFDEAGALMALAFALGDGHPDPGQSLDWNGRPGRVWRGFSAESGAGMLRARWVERLLVLGEPERTRFQYLVGRHEFRGASSVTSSWLEPRGLFDWRLATFGAALTYTDTNYLARESNDIRAVNLGLELESDPTSGVDSRLVLLDRRTPSELEHRRRVHAEFSHSGSRLSAPPRARVTLTRPSGTDQEEPLTVWWVLIAEVTR